MTKHHHSLGRESFIVGLIGATVVAAWFLVIDTVNGRPFATPSILGQVILFGEDTPVLAPIMWPAVAAYSGLHMAAFLLFGAVVTKLVFLADLNGIFRFALMMLFVAFEVFFYGVLVMFFQGTSGLFPLWSILAANTVAAFSMGGYLFGRHPALRRGLGREPLGG